MADGFIDRSTLRTETPSPVELEYAADAVDRYAIEYLPIEDAPLDTAWGLYEVTTPERAEIAHRFAEHFHRETPWDMPPYTAGDERREGVRVFLIRSPRFQSLIPLAGGCVGLQKASLGWVVTWMWMHPLDRGSVKHSTGPSVAARTFDALEVEFGTLLVEAPLSKAMSVLAKKRGYRSVERR